MFNIPQVKARYLLVASTVLFALWLLLVIGLRPEYLAATETSALAMINVLSPYYWIILVLFVVVCFFAFTSKVNPRWLHIILLSQFALMLFYTPFLIGGYSWSPDSLWHAGVAKYFPSIINGANYDLAQYCQTYPFSFGITYYTESLLQIDTVTYSLYVFPPICIVLFSSLAYLFISRLTNARNALISMLIALPTLHYIEPHVSPFATGTVLVLASFVLLTYKTRIAYALNLLVIAALVVTHPISPLFLGVYLAAILGVVFIERLLRALPLRSTSTTLSIKKEHQATWPYLAILLCFLTFFWLYWTMYVAAPNYSGVEAPVKKVLSLGFIDNLANAVEWTAGDQGFIYPQISQLSLSIYAIFLVGVFIISIVNIFKIFWVKSLTGIDYLRLRLSITALGSAVISYLLFSSSGERFLLGRGLIFLLIMSSICIATYLTYPKLSIRRTKILRVMSFAFLLVLVCSYPIVAYSKEAYNTFTAPAQEGLEFISKLDLANKTISMGYDQQLAAYVDLSKNLNLTGFPPNLAVQKPDYIVLRINSYYFLSMRYDLSFHNNTYTQLYNYLVNGSVEYIKIFSNSQFEVYQKQAIQPSTVCHSEIKQPSG